jgi:hypothetical protein
MDDECAAHIRTIFSVIGNFCLSAAVSSRFLKTC